MNRIFLLILCLPISFGLTACSSNVSSEVDTGEVKATAAAETGGEYSLNQKNPFEWSADDVERGQNGNFEGGKRSQYDGKSSSAY
ncbi:hypothetical protein N9133_03375, partial [Akkermansiaceae bacterium]|nr:hypothetical protein [Akkermansiaceae bacterium]